MSSKKIITNMDIIREMTLMDDIFMTVVFENRPDCVEDILRIILSFEPKVEKVETQYDYSSVYGRSVKFDILARDKDNTLYDIEIQRANKGAVPKRARYHSSMLDTKALDKNEDFEQLRETYVIFITEHDILGKNIPVYTIKRMIEETNDYFNDGEHIIYINTAYKGMDVTEIEKLINGIYIEEYLSEYLTYHCLYAKNDNIWSILYFTGYLTALSPYFGISTGENSFPYSSL